MSVRLGGVMQATAGIKGAHADRIIDAPLNEPLIMGTDGAGLHKDITVLPEIQFGDYSLNAFHWFVHMGNLYWCTNGNANFRTIMRTPVDLLGGGAVYHSMSIDGYFAPIPGLVILMPSTSFDAFAVENRRGLRRSGVGSGAKMDVSPELGAGLPRSRPMPMRSVACGRA